MRTDILTLDDFDFQDRTVIVRLDINSPVDHRTGELIELAAIAFYLPAMGVRVLK